jgi:hypothetical protein
MSAVRQIKSEYRVAGFEERQINGLIRLGTGMRLHICKFGSKQLGGPIARQVFDFVNVLTTTIVPATGVTLGVLVCQNAANRFHDGRAGVVFAGDHLQPVLLSARLGNDVRVQFGIDRIEIAHVLAALQKFASWQAIPRPRNHQHEKIKVLIVSPGLSIVNLTQVES